MDNHADVEHIVKLARKLPPHYLKRWGRILYSSVETISHGDIYLLGLNPAGESSEPKDFLEKDIENLPDRKINAYIDEAWARANQYKAGCAPLQKRVKWLLSELVDNAAAVCASNLVFLGTNNAADVKDEWIDECWPVHDKLIDIIKPRLIITFGNGNSSVSPYSYLRRKFAEFSIDDKPIPAGHGSWQCRGFQTTIREVPTFVAGLPHLSRYDIIDKFQVLNWLKLKLVTINR